MMTLGEVSMLVSAAGAVPYIRQIVRGQVRPERTTWLVWSLILALALISYRASGANDSEWFVLGDFAVTAAIFLLSLWRGEGGWNRLDVGCLGIATVSLAVWQLASVPLLAVWGALAADAVALVPTVLKALRDPRSESVSTYAFSSAAAVLGIVAVGQWNFQLLFYPVYLFLANFVTAMVVWVGQYQVARVERSKGGVI